MGDQPPPFDPCECIFSPAGAMRRLISLLRNSQSYCTDEQCFGMPPSPGNNEDTGLTVVYMAIAWVVLAMVLYMMRPQSLRDGNKPSQMRDDHDDDHHSQPPVM